MTPNIEAWIGELEERIRALETETYLLRKQLENVQNDVVYLEGVVG